MRRRPSNFAEKSQVMTARQRSQGTNVAHRGITLYEVVLALAIFSGSIAAISQGIATGTRAALQSRLRSQAILLSESKMAEVLCGAVPPVSTNDAPFIEPGLDGWRWKLQMGPGPRTGVLRMEVLVTCQRVHESVDASYSLVRLVRDPNAFQNSSTTATAAQNAVATQTQQPTAPLPSR